MKAKHHILTAAARFAVALCACIALAACTGDANEPHNTGHDRTPLVFTASVYASPAATRANTAANKWTAGDWVAVEMDGVVKRYLVSATGATATLSPADAENTHYLPDGDLTVRAWRYGHTVPFTENFDWNYKPAKWWTWATQHFTSDGESHYQQSDFLYAPEVTVGNSAVSGGNIGLTFYHQTARVVINIREGGAVKAENKEKIDVTLGVPVDATPESSRNLSIYGTFNAGLIDPANGQYSGLEADVTMGPSFVTAKPIVPATEGYACSYEALVIPQNMSGQEFIEVNIPELYPDNPTPSPETGSYYYTPKDGEADLQGGYTYTYDLTVSEHGSLHVTPGTPIEGWGPGVDAGSGMAYEKVIDLNNQNIINDNSTYLLTGTKLDAPRLLVQIGGGSPTIILKDADIQGELPIVIEGGTPTIRVEGKNQIIDEEGPAIYLYNETANVRIIGDGRDKNRLTVESWGGVYNGSPAIGSNLGFCGDISLSGITLVAESWNCPAIGVGGMNSENRKCGSITITDCHVEATARDGSAAIGFGYVNANEMDNTHEMGDITITNSTLKCTVEPKKNVWPAHIGGSARGVGQYTVGKITITPPEGTHGTEFFRDFTKGDGSAMLDNDVIVGFPEGAKPTNGAEFDVYWNNRSQGPVIRWGDRGGLQ